MYKAPSYNVSKSYPFSLPSFLGGVVVGAGVVIGAAALSGASCYSPKNLENRVR